MKLTLRALRVNKGLSAKEVADIIGVKDHKTILNWEKGKHKIPYHALVKLADIYECDLPMINL